MKSIHIRMKKGMVCALSIALLASILPLSPFAVLGSGEEMHYSYVDIVDRLVDLEVVSTLPLPGERAGEWSSYDRASGYNETADAYVNWGANGDGGGVIQNLGDAGDGKGVRYKVAAMTGPGVIWRIWSAQAGSGLIEIYIDGEETPTIAKPFNQLFNGTDPVFGYSALSYTAASGLNCFVPITYNQSCEVYLYGSWGNYYQFTYATLPQGTTVESMPKTFSAADRAALTRANDFLRDDLGQLPPADDTILLAESKEYTVPAHGSAKVAGYDGQGALARFRVKVNEDLSYNDMWKALKELTVSMFWDGAVSPGVWAPLGDFFGSPNGPTYYRTLPMGLGADDWFYCYFYMPFQSGAEVVIGNDGAVDRRISVEFAVTALRRPVAEYARFHAKWNRNAFQTTRPDRWPDYTILQTTGAGRFLGMSLHVYKKDDVRDPGAGAGDYWWGEGDEKFFVDGEMFPSSFGTGTEDYFGYAWCDPTVFAGRAFHAQNFNEGGVHNRGNRAVARYQLADSVPFQSSFEGSLEKYYKNNTEYGVVAYWYQNTPDDAYAAVPLEDRTDYYVMKEIDESLFEGEQMPYVRDGGTDAHTQTMVPNYSDRGWSNGQQLLWLQPGTGDSLEYTFKVRNALAGELKISVTKSYDFGIFQFYLDGMPIGPPVDTYNPKVIVSGSIRLGYVELPPGEHKLRAVVVGRNARSSGSLLGFDCFRVDPVAPVPGIIEGEDMEVIYASGGNPVVQNMTEEWPTAGTYSNGKQVWWQRAVQGPQSNDLRDGDELILAMDLEEAFDGELLMNFTKANDYGTFRLALDGEDIGDLLDLYSAEGVRRAGPVSFGRVRLSAGRHLLSVTVNGHNSASSLYLFGLDNIVLQSVRENAVILGRAGDVSGKKDTVFTLPVSVRVYPDAPPVTAFAGTLQLPASVSVDEVRPRAAVAGTLTWEVDEDTGILSYRYTGDPVTVSLDEETEILALVVRLSAEHTKGEQLVFKALSLEARFASGLFAYETGGFESVSTAFVVSTGAFSVSARTLYTGDGVDFVPLGRKAVAVTFTGVDGTEDVMALGEQFYYAEELSQKSDGIVYVGFVDENVTDAQLANEGSYAIAGGANAKTVLFGDANGDGTVDAEDARRVLAIWLRRIAAPEEREILAINVNADARVDVGDFNEIVDKVVDGLAVGILSQ
ncbi:MAG: DUF2961 domain-containing protein [Oscillospiraceae bacterium]|jgi:hypothetical protein|nr:DUF2961 domain-containing protein [Oscillospiraceae bacterium]